MSKELSSAGKNPEKTKKEELPKVVVEVTRLGTKKLVVIDCSQEGVPVKEDPIKTAEDAERIISELDLLANFGKRRGPSKGSVKSVHRNKPK